IAKSVDAFRTWREVPAPRRGELVRLLGEELRANKEQLGTLVSLETGKILQEGLGEVQEMIDICDFAVGLSRQLYGLTIASERPGHRMQETWHPLGPVAIMTAFNFPVAVWSWNAALALVGNNAMIVAPSADLDLAARAILFAAVGTAGQRCTSLRRLIVHRSIYATLIARLAAAYRSVPIGDPLETGTLVGPLIDKRA